MSVTSLFLGNRLLALQPFFWNKLPPYKLQTTVWNDIEQPEISLDLKELEDMFTVDNSNTSKLSQTAKGSTKNQAVATLLDITRANHIGESTQLHLVINVKHPNSDHAFENQIIQSRHSGRRPIFR